MIPTRYPITAVVMMSSIAVKNENGLIEIGKEMKCIRSIQTVNFLARPISTIIDQIRCAMAKKLPRAIPVLFRLSLFMFITGYYVFLML